MLSTTNETILIIFTQIPMKIVLVGCLLYDGNEDTTGKIWQRTGFQLKPLILYTDTLNKLILPLVSLDPGDA